MMLTVKLTKSSSSDPQDTGIEPAVNPPCWGSETAVSLNLTIPSASLSSVSLLLQPVLATLLAWALFSETIGPSQLIGGGVVLGGIWLARRGS